MSSNLYCIISGQYYPQCPFGVSGDKGKIYRYASWIAARGRAVAYYEQKVDGSRGALFYAIPPSTSVAPADAVGALKKIAINNAVEAAVNYLEFTRDTDAPSVDYTLAADKERSSLVDIEKLAISQGYSAVAASYIVATQANNDALSDSQNATTLVNGGTASYLQTELAGKIGYNYTAANSAAATLGRYPGATAGPNQPAPPPPPPSAPSLPPPAKTVTAPLKTVISGVGGNRVYKEALAQGLFTPTYSETSGYSGPLQLAIPYSAPRSYYHVYYPAAQVKVVLKTLDVFIQEGVHLSSDDDKESSWLSSRYSDSRGAGALWSDRRVVISPNATSSQLMVGNFGFKIPSNAVISAVEIDAQSVVVAGSVSSESVGGLTCKFAPPFFDALLNNIWFNGPTYYPLINGYIRMGPLVSPTFSAFPPGFQPGVNYTTLKVIVNNITNNVGIVAPATFKIMLTDTNNNIVGSASTTISDFGVSTTISFALTDFGVPFSSSWVMTSLLNGAPFNIGTVDFLEIEFLP